MDCANTLTLCKHHTQFSTSGNLTLDQRKQDKDEAGCWTITQKNWGANWRYSLCFTKYKKTVGLSPLDGVIIHTTHRDHERKTTLKVSTLSDKYFLVTHFTKSHVK
ncbi:hypothetical protein RP20_CCG005257 [Aedes albopictus]|nr:hypothetical protein RP20_CCG005257 [Aedes albopictus]